MSPDRGGSKDHPGEIPLNIIGIVGYPASGKGEFSDTAKTLGIPVVVMGDIIRKKTAEAGLELIDANIGMTAHKLREQYGMDAVAILTAEEVKKLDAKTVIIDGIRGDAEILYFKKTFLDFKVIYVQSSFDIRLARMMTRSRSDDANGPAALAVRDKREESFGLQRATALADIIVPNETDRDTYVREVRRILSELQ